MSEDSKLEIVVATKDSLPVRSETGSGLVARGLRDAKIGAELEAAVAARFAAMEGDRIARLREAFPSIRERAESGDADAQCDLGQIYYHGEILPKDASEAAKWYRQAAMRGHIPAQADLGMMLFQGKGIERNIVQAYYWSALAAQQGDDIAQVNLKEIAKEMNPVQVTEAETQVADWIRNAKRTWK